MAGQPDHPYSFTKTDTNGYRVDQRFSGGSDPVVQPGANIVQVGNVRAFEQEERPRLGRIVEPASHGAGRNSRWRGLGKANVKRQELAARAPRALSPRAMTRYLRAVEACPSVRDRAIALLPFYAGLRVSEVAGLGLDDISMSARKGSIRIVGKGEKTRTVPLHAKLREALTAWLAERPAGDGALFVTRIGTRPTAEAVNDVIASITRTAGLDEHVTVHVLRHCFGTNLVRDGVDLPTVAGLMGHARLETTRRYSAPSADDLERAIAGLPVDA